MSDLNWKLNMMEQRIAALEQVVGVEAPAVTGPVLAPEPPPSAEEVEAALRICERVGIKTNA